jgi:AMP deaminase
MLTLPRIDRYTRANQASGNALTRSNLQPEVPQTPKSMQGTHPGSPMQSTTHASTANHELAFSKLPPAQQARLNPSASAADMASLQGQPSSPTSTKDGGGTFDRPRRTSSVTINPSMAQSTEFFVPEEEQGLTRSTSSVAMDGEPRLFPGIVSRNRRRSTKVEESEGSGSVKMGFRRGDTSGSVVEERDTDEEDL